MITIITDLNKGTTATRIIDTSKSFEHSLPLPTPLLLVFNRLERRQTTTTTTTTTHMYNLCLFENYITHNTTSVTCKHMNTCSCVVSEQQW